MPITATGRAEDAAQESYKRVELSLMLLAVYSVSAARKAHNSSAHNVAVAVLSEMRTSPVSNSRVRQAVSDANSSGKYWPPGST